MTEIEVTHLWCPESGAPEGSDNSTHHLVPRGTHPRRGMACRYCGRPEYAIRRDARKEQDSDRA